MDILPLGFWLDLIGTFVFGISGAMLAVRRGLDVFGIAVLSVVAGLAGGIMRDVVLGAEPPSALADSRYLLAALAAALCVFLFHHLFERLSKPVMVLDAAGLGLFAASGSRRALEAGLEPLSVILLGVLTAIGGGVVRDLLVAEVPRVLREEVYALAALIGASMICVGAWLGLPELAAALAAVISTFLVRVISVWRGWQAPKAPGA